MKFYQFNEDTGLYEGEIFLDGDILPYISGVTTVVPPEYEQGEVPVFEIARQQWIVLPVSVIRQLLLGRKQ